MRVVLIRPPVTGPKGFPVVPDLGLLYLAKALQQAGLPVQVRDGWLEKDRERAMGLDLAADGPVLVGFKLFSLGIKDVRPAIQAIKRRNPQALVAVGGPHPSGVGTKIWADVPEADFALAGEGEIGLPQLARALDGGTSPETLAQIPGLIWRSPDGPLANECAFVPDLDALDQPAWGAVPAREYLARPTPIRKAPHLPVLTSRGCPFDCTYCAGRLITGTKMRFRSAEKMVDEIEFLHREYGAQVIAITDDNFSLSRKHVERFCEAMLARNLPVRWDCLSTGLRLDTLDETLLQLMERSGCFAVSVAVESGSPRILAHMQKKTDLDVMAEKIRLIRRTTKMRINSYYIIGYPAERREDVAATVRFARRSAAHHVLFFLFTPLPGAPVTEQLIAEKQLPPTRWEDFRYDLPSLPLADMSIGALKRRQVWATFSFYFGRPWRLLSLLRDVWSPTVLRDFANRVFSLFRRQG
ncbi:MAG: B12-binding domain-containing radical SAM protein [Alphaproteobacteria bacterium]